VILNHLEDNDFDFDLKSFVPHCMEYRRGLAMTILSVYPCRCLSVKRGDCYKTEYGSVQSFIPYERPFSLVF